MTELERSSYPGLNPEAADLWRKFLRLYENQFDRFEYNVRVGRGLDPGPSATPELRAMWFAVTTKRIDVVAGRLDQTWVIEIEPRPGLRTHGQIDGYLYFLPKYYPVRAHVRGALICEQIGFDMFGLIHSSGVLIFQFQPGRQPKLPPDFLPGEGLAAASQLL